MADEYINPVVQANADAVSDTRVQERTALDYPRHFWSSLKNGHYRYALTGVAIGAPLSAAIGLAVAAAASVAIGWVAAPFIVAAFTGAGTLMVAEGFAEAGTAAASRASGLAEKHARELDPANAGQPLKTLDDKLMYNGRGHHYEFPADRDDGKFYSMKSGLTGTAIGVASGGLLGLAGSAAATGAGTVGAAIAGAVAHIPGTALVASALAHVGLAAMAPFAAPAIIGALVFGAFGATFGIDRSVLKSMADSTDALTQGNTQSKQGPDLGRAQSPETNAALLQHRLRRQAEIGQLEKSYSDKIFWGSIVGRFKGFAGVLPGIAVGAAAGLAVAGLLVATGGAGLIFSGAVAAHAIATIVPAFAAAGGMYGMNVLTQSGTEAGAESTARAIDTEFERNRILQQHGVPLSPKEKDNTSYFNGRTALIMGAVGLAAGAAVSPVLGLGIAHVIPALAGVSTAASTLIGGLVGSSYGLNIKAMKAMSKPANWLYDKAYFSHGGKDAPQVMQAPVPMRETAITSSEAALLNDRLAAGAGKSYTQIAVQQQQVLPATAMVGG